MISTIRTLAKITFKETIRDRILIVILVFSFLLLATTLFLGTISLDQDNKIIIDLGLSGIFLFGTAITIFTGATTIAKELDQRTAYTLLARPIKRSWFLLGKYFGLLATLALLTLLMAVVFITLVVFRLGWAAIDLSLILGIFYTYCEFCLLLAILIFFSTFSTTIMSVIYGLAVFMIGHSSSVILELIQSSHNTAVRYLFTGLYYFFPNFEKFNIRNDIVYHLRPDITEIALTLCYGILYSSIMLYLSAKIFQKQEL